jgi:hypothetical protein
MLAVGDTGEWRLWLKVDEATRGRFEDAASAASKGPRSRPAPRRRATRR